MSCRVTAEIPGLSYGISGMADEERKLGVSLMVGFGLAILGIYALLAIPPDPTCSR